MHACSTFLRNWQNSSVKRNNLILSFFWMLTYKNLIQNITITSSPVFHESGSRVVYVNIYRQNSKSRDTSLFYRTETLGQEIYHQQTYMCQKSHVFLSFFCLQKLNEIYFNYAYVPKILIHRTFTAI